jgi:NADPH-dependent ferric siderophore reductase
VTNDFGWNLLIGDETALPAKGHRVEQLCLRVHVTTILAVIGNADHQSL